MGVPTSEVGYTSAMPRREDHDVHKDMWGHRGGKERKKKKLTSLWSGNLTKHIPGGLNIFHIHNPKS